MTYFHESRNRVFPYFSKCIWKVTCKIMHLIITYFQYVEVSEFAYSIYFNIRKYASRIIFRKFQHARPQTQRGESLFLCARTGGKFPSIHAASTVGLGQRELALEWIQKEFKGVGGWEKFRTRAETKGDPPTHPSRFEPMLIQRRKNDEWFITNKEKGKYPSSVSSET